MSLFSAGFYARMNRQDEARRMLANALKQPQQFGEGIALQQIPFKKDAKRGIPEVKDARKRLTALK